MFRFRVRLKPSKDRGEFEVDWARCSKNIAENSFAMGHATSSTHVFALMPFSSTNPSFDHLLEQSHRDPQDVKYCMYLLSIVFASQLYY